MMRERFETIFTFTTMKTKTCQIPFHSIVELFHRQGLEQLYYNIFICIFHHVLLMAIVMMIVGCGYAYQTTASLYPIDSYRTSVELSTPF